MSSAVSYEYRVREEELRRRRELQAARDALLAAEQRYERMRVHAAEQQQTWGDSVSVPDRLASAVPSEDAAQLRGAAQRFEQSTSAAEKRLDDEVVAARIAAFQEGMSAIKRGASEPIAAEAALERTAPVLADGGPEGEEEEVEAALARLIARLDPAVEDRVVEEVRVAADAVRRATSASGREQGVNALRLNVQEANGEARERRERERLLDRSEARLNGFDGPEAVGARRLVAEIRGGREVPADLEATVDAAVERETRSQEAEYVSEELRSALEGLGYRVGPDFETTLLSDGYTQFSRSEWAGYAVRVRSGGHPPRLNFNVVRGDASRADQEARDKEVEEEFCDRQVEVIERLAQAGISAERTRVVEPGDKPIQVVEGLEGAAGAEASRAAAKEMGR
ncbi:MAG: hypothetical protein WB507_03680 [Solirubrobacterales bacterium]